MTEHRLLSIHPQGFSLIEVMIAMVMVAVALLGLSEFTKMGANSNMSTQLNTDFANLSSAILYTLGSSRLCTEALGNGISASNQQHFPAGLPSAQSLGTMSVGAPPLTPSPIASIGPVPGSMSGLSVTKLEFNKVYASYPAGNGTNYLVNIYLEAKKVMPNGTPYLGAPALSRNFLVNVNVDSVSNSVLGCN